MREMQRTIAIAAALALGGCVTGAAVVRKDRVSLPILVGAVAADIIVSSIVASQVQDYSTGGSIVTGVAVTALDTGVGCVLGACSSLLKP